MYLCDQLLTVTSFGCDTVDIASVTVVRVAGVLASRLTLEAVVSALCQHNTQHYNLIPIDGNISTRLNRE